MPTIPEVRDKLTAIAARMRRSPDFEMVFLADEIDVAVGELVRRKVTRRAPVKIAPLTEDEKRLIRTMAWANPTMSQLEIANRVGTNPGRVSEALNGKRQ